MMIAHFAQLAVKIDFFAPLALTQFSLSFSTPNLTRCCCRLCVFKEDDDDVDMPNFTTDMINSDFSQLPLVHILSSFLGKHKFRKTLEDFSFV